jgi:hypothetical protein
MLFPTVERSSPNLAAAVTQRVWACVNLQWEWLGGEKAPREELQRGAPREVSRAA